MSTFQAVVLGIVHGLTEFFPLSPEAHEKLIPYLLNWPDLPQSLSGAFGLGSLAALLIYFRHDWSSIISSFIQVIIFRKRPMTLDERLPIFIFVATIPYALAWFYLRPVTEIFFSHPLRVAISFFIFGILLLFADSLNRQNKGMFDWNWLDSLIVGICQALMLITGSGRTATALGGAFLRGYRREAATKFILFIAAPILAGAAFWNLHAIDFHASDASIGVSWLTFWVALCVSFLASIMALGGFMKQIQSRKFGTYAIYRLALVLAVISVYWLNK